MQTFQHRPRHPHTQRRGIEWKVRPISHHETRLCSGDTVKVILVLSLKSQGWEPGLSPTLTFTRISMYVADGHYQHVLCCSDTSQPAQMLSANSLCYFQVDLASGSHPGFLQSEESAPVVPDELSPGTWCGTNLLLCSSGKFQLKIKISFWKVSWALYSLELQSSETPKSLVAFYLTSNITIFHKYSSRTDEDLMD